MIGHAFEMYQSELSDHFSHRNAAEASSANDKPLVAFGGSDYGVESQLCSLLPLVWRTDPTNSRLRFRRERAYLDHHRYRIFPRHTSILHILRPLRQS